jgi:hypothetical protein
MDGLEEAAPENPGKSNSTNNSNELVKEDEELDVNKQSAKSDKITFDLNDVNKTTDET